MTLRHLLPFTAMLLAGALVAAGCGGSGGESSSDGAGSSTAAEAKELPEGTIGVELGEFFVRPSSDSIAAGEVTFEVENVGSAAHELVIYHTDAEPDSLEQDGGIAKLDEAEVVDRTDELSGGDTATLTVDLAAGSYLLLCNLPGHYQSGQVIAFEVT